MYDPKGITQASEDADNTAFPEGNLLLLHRDGDPRAFARLVAEYRRPVYSYLIRCRVAESDCDDLFQEIFIKIHRAAVRYDRQRPLHPWLFTIVANTVRTYHRSTRVRQMVFADSNDVEPRAVEADGERHAMAAQTATWLEQEIGRLPLPQREVLILTCIEKLPQKDVAQILGRPVNTIKTLLRRARLALVGRMTERDTRTHGEVPS